MTRKKLNDVYTAHERRKDRMAIIILALTIILSVVIISDCIKEHKSITATYGTTK